MNKFFICFLSICLCASAYAQNNVGIGTPTPNAAAVLDLTATTQGFLAPRTQVALVANPVAGLVIFDTDSNCYVMYNNAGVWKNLCSPGTAWLITGNSGTNSGVNFAGTTDAQDFVLKSNNSEVLRATTTGAVGINTPVPDPTSILDMTSTTRGVLFPALTTAQRDAITTPAVGLVIYDTDINVHQFWNGTCWVNVGQTVCSFVYTTSYVTPSHNADCLLVSNFSSVSDTISVGLVSGTPSPVILTAVGVPAGVIVSFSNNYLLPPQTSIMTFTALPSAASGTYNITVLATSGSTVQTLNYTLVVFGFNLAITPPDTTVSSSNLTSGGYVSQAVVSIGNASTCASNGGTAQLSVSSINGPSSTGISVSFGTTSMPIPGSTIMTITSNCPPAGVYTITVEAQIGVTQSYATYVLTVTGTSAIHVTTNQTNLDLSTLFPPGACSGSDTVIIDPGVNICSSSPTIPAMTTGSLTSGTLTIINNGTIMGAGGAGGADPSNVAQNSCPTANGGQGGDAIDIASSIHVNIINNGTIASGGGGGGAGAALGGSNIAALCGFSLNNTYPGGGGGGGAGCVGGLGGISTCTNGANGTSSAGGAGGPSSASGGCGNSCSLIIVTISGNSGNGGNGGGLGQPGSAGGSYTAIGGITVSASCPAGSGGAPGYSVNGGGYSNYVTSGTAVIGPTHN